MLEGIRPTMLEHSRQCGILFIDFDGVLCHDRFWRSLPHELRSSVDHFLFSDHFPIVVQWMRGHCASEEVNEVLAHFVGIAYKPLWQVFVHDCRTMNVSLAHMRSIQCIRRFMPVVVVAGNMDCFERFTVPSLGLRNYFDDVVNSAVCGRLKTDDDGRLFSDLCERYGIEQSRAVLIDDAARNRLAMENGGGQALDVKDWQALSDVLWEIEMGEYF